MTMAALYPSLMCAHPLTLEKTIKQLEPLCDGFHLDLMDNQFVPNLEGSVPLVNAIVQTTQKPLWIHLMVTNPINLIERISLRPEDIVDIHVEIQPKLVTQSLELIRYKKGKASLALRPSTPIDTIEPYVPYIDQLLIMSVEPGFSGQKFIENTYKRIAQAQQLRATCNASFTIAGDGGINQNNIEKLIDAEMTDFVIGSALFDTADIATTMKRFTTLAHKKSRGA